jgi:hypothetical protein
LFYNFVVFKAILSSLKGLQIIKELFTETQYFKERKKGESLLVIHEKVRNIGVKETDKLIIFNEGIKCTLSLETGPVIKNFVFLHLTHGFLNTSRGNPVFYFI